MRLTISSQDKIIRDLHAWNECALLNVLPCIQSVRFISNRWFLGVIGALHSHSCLYRRQLSMQWQIHQATPWSVKFLLHVLWGTMEPCGVMEESISASEIKPAISFHTVCQTNLKKAQQTLQSCKDDELISCRTVIKASHEKNFLVLLAAGRFDLVT